MRFWDTILPQIQISTEADSAVVNGAYTDVGEFQKLHLQRNPQELSEDDVAFWSYVKPDQRPATVAGAAQDNYSDEESEDNDSDEEGDIDEDMMDID